MRDEKLIWIVVIIALVLIFSGVLKGLFSLLYGILIIVVLVLLILWLSKQIKKK